MFGRMATAGLDLSETRGVLMCRFIKKRLGFTALYCLSSAPAGAGTRPNPRHSRLSDVVGYQEVAVPAGSSMRTATFKAISGDYKISDIKVSDTVVGGGNDMIQKINADGSWGDLYYYLTLAGTGYVEDGWYKDDYGGVPVTDADVISVGEGVIVSSISDFTLTFSGEVIAGNPSIPVPSGFCMVGNPTPVTVKISSIGVSDTVVGGGNDMIQKINADGSWGDLYYYLTLAGTGYVEDGWYKDDYGGEAVTDSDVLAPGESVMFSAVSGLNLTFPAAL